MSDFNDIIAKRDLITNEEINYHVIKNFPYNGWASTFVGDGTIIFSKSGEKDIKAYRGREVEDWLLETWLECKAKIDKISLK
ncbi:hypothetical protein SAMN04487895_101651 [Paenibacillus sophorae]|uniref:Uncharacterized protein n=1 Tax=Paenibacillus sophorae TaxID=1333845 RepID=A0A1H8GUN8_9BACL|nr:hypothetical protein [Paenibacillus sophorae]QWU14348.1 hypothetical protein KP014_20800 [Paenibacillus sophorae]SEN47676.1 hypothetical protein SAMN04487895_101651 [Paenibacillus sophorae]